MCNYRIELRIFGLLIFALLSTLILAYGLDVADVQGSVMGIKFNIVGPSAAFIALILIFFATGLFKFGLENDGTKTVSYPMDKLTLDEIENQLDQLLLKNRRNTRRKTRLEKAKLAIQGNASNDEVLIASGMRPVRRPES